MFANVFLASANHLLAPANWARERLQPHAGRTGRLVLKPLLEIDFSVSGDGHLASWVSEDPPDVVLELSFAELPRLLEAGTSAAMRHVRIEGNAEFADAIGFVFRNLRWDAEEDLARVFGDIAARRITTAVRRTSAQGEQIVKRIGGSVGEYLVDEAAMLVPASALPPFRDELTRLRDALARLDKRIDRLASRN